MKAAMLAISVENLTYADEDWTHGIVPDYVNGILLVTYTDSVVYRRLLILNLGRVLADKHFQILRRYVMQSSSSQFSIIRDDRYNTVTTRQINWARTHRLLANDEERQLTALIKAKGKEGGDDANVGE